AITLWEAATGKIRGGFPGHGYPALALAFAPDGRTLTTGSSDTTGLVWDLTDRSQGTALMAKSLAPADLDACWADLAGNHAARAYREIKQRAGSRKDAIPCLQKRLQPAPAVDEKQVARLIADLDNDDFTSRENAFRELEKLGEGVLGLCRKT